MGLAVRIELANVVTVQRLHDADPGKHRRSAVRRDQDQRFHRCLPFLGFMLGLAFGSFVM
jgi:hypothetical protein